MIGVGKGSSLPRKVIKTKIVSMNINPLISKPYELEQPRYKRSPIKHPNRNTSLPPIKC